MEQTPLLPNALPTHLPSGLDYRADFVSVDEERALLATVGSLALQHSRYRQYTARRRTVSYGAGYDFSHLKTTAAPPLPDFLDEIRQRAARWIGVRPEDFVQALVSEYQPGTPLGWHRDVPEYEAIVCVSLASACRVRFRRYQWDPRQKGDIFALEPQPRSAYVLRGDARWGWQHSVPPVKALRYSITLRTARSAER